MQSLKTIRRRIQSVKNTQKVTSAMKLVAAARLRRAQKNAISAKPYTSSLFDIAKRVSEKAGPDAPPLMRRRTEVGNYDALVITSDRGLCGDFNEGLLRMILDGLQMYEQHNIGGNLFVIGKKGVDFLKSRRIEAKRVDADPKKIVKVFTERFLSGSSDGAFIAYNQFVSAGHYKSTIKDLLPLHFRGEGPGRFLNYIFEPNMKDVRDDLVQMTVTRLIEQALLDSNAAELSARMIAMDNATKNADEMITHLTLEYNKARQSSITGELLDIVGGAEALK